RAGHLAAGAAGCDISAALSVIRKSGNRFSLATNATRLRGDHADIESPAAGQFCAIGMALSSKSF
ncbi:hypothetical protein, partial [Bradyrhizobium brasilense]|uniref:hypothetical protein n=1 Tax=Bradyrhizobium brasilense TaxID=1419277 RepID=UPI001AED2E9A